MVLGVRWRKQVLSHIPAVQFIRNTVSELSRRGQERGRLDNARDDLYRHSLATRVETDVPTVIRVLNRGTGNKNTRAQLSRPDADGVV